MELLIKRYLGLGSALTAGGLLLTLAGAWGIRHFFDGATPDGASYTVPQVARGLVLPHVAVLFGLAGLCLGAILLFKGLAFRRQWRRRQEEAL